MQTLEQIRDNYEQVLQKYEEVSGYVDLEEKDTRIKALRQKTMEADFWQDNQRAEKISKEISDLEYEIERWKKLDLLRQDIELQWMMLEEESGNLNELAKLVDRFSRRIHDLEIEKLLSGERDRNNAILIIHPGAGGTESHDWASMLYRMYTRWVERRGFEYEVLNFQPGDEAGIKEAAIEIRGVFAYGYLKSEIGVHRLVRISPFNAQGKRQTSFASVFVYPEIDNDIEVEINPSDLRIDTFRASGAGGQHVNKTDSAIRITHIPTNIVVTCQNERSQHKNKESAMKVLRSRLYEEELKKQQMEKAELDKAKTDIGWGSQIRSYVFQPYTLVKDTRTQYETGNLQAVMDGDIDGFIQAHLKYQYTDE
ncbi:MAG: peptide chain release factor 2 [Candidatus Marinimicrobia bacterium]|nr:peptide chain release factor 2 [Candidatus Neomarinimicrobiota bacterium]